MPVQEGKVAYDTLGCTHEARLVGPDGEVKKHWKRVAKAANHPAKVLGVLNG